jgi:DNA-binding NarL/FixJ family response regulator
LLTGQDAIVPSTSLAQLLNQHGRVHADSAELTSQVAPGVGVDFEAQGLQFPDAGISGLTIGLIDCYQFSQECLIKAFESLHPRLSILPFLSVQACIARGRSDVDLIIYYSHASEGSEAAAMQNVAAIRQAFVDIPLIVLSDAEDAQQPKTIRSTLKSGAHGFIPTRTTGIPIALAAIRFVKAGGTFAPLDLLLTNRSERGSALPEAARQSRLTTRQMAVLSHLQQGKANKIIAHELGMSESTVKVHVRNIMRKMGATNRTQAAYKAQKIWDNAEFARMSDL